MSKIRVINETETKYYAGLVSEYESLCRLYGRPPFLLNHSGESWFDRMVEIANLIAEFELSLYVE